MSKIIDKTIHSHPSLNQTDEQLNLHHGIDLSKNLRLPPHESGSSQTESHDYLIGKTKNKNKQDVLVKEAPPWDDLFSELHHDKESEEFSPAQRETLFHNLAHNFYGLGQHVPTTSTFHHGGKNYSAQKWVQNPIPAFNANSDQFDDLKEITGNPQHLKTGQENLHKLGLMDILNSQQDRHQANYLYSKGDKPEDSNVHLIDNSGSFIFPNSKNGKRFDIPKYLGSVHNEIHPNAVKWLQSLKKEDLSKELKKNKVPNEIHDNTIKAFGNAQELLKENHLNDQGSGMTWIDLANELKAMHLKDQK